MNDDAIDGVQVPVNFEFVSERTGSHCCKPWLTVLPMRGFIHIGLLSSTFISLVCTVYTVQYFY